MMRRIVPLSCATLAWLLLALMSLRGQGVDFFDTDPAVFIKEYREVLTESRQDAAQEAGEAMTTLWNSGTMSAAEQETFIMLTNQLVSLRLPTHPSLTQFTETYIRLKQDRGTVHIPADRFLAVTAQCAERLSHQDVERYLQVLAQYTEGGYPIHRTRYYWHASAESPQLTFEEIRVPKGKRLTPVIRFAQTDLKYYSSRSKDSTLIVGTGGDFYPLSLTFKGKGGRVTWEKVGLSPEDVYCDLGVYQLNFNYGLVKVDTATLHYKSLIDHPIKGRFEDRNIGYRDPSKANYPLFQSHEGGVVIDKLITNFRYEGGFTLRGQRKVGTGYNTWEAYSLEGGDGEAWEAGGTGGTEPEAYDDEFADTDWSDTDWADTESEEATFDDTDSDFDSWDAGGVDESGGGFGGGFGGFQDKMQVHYPAKMELMRGDRAVLKLTGEAFLLEREKMRGRNLEATIYTNNGDSIYHPDMDLRYISEDSIVVLEKPRGGTFRNVPFVSSYHEYYLYFETIVWDLAEDQMSFTALIDRENKVSAIESFDYFTRSRMNRYKGVMKFNPVGAIYRFQLKYPDQPITPENILKDFGLLNDRELGSFERALPDLEGAGFLTYDRVTHEISPLPKLINYAQAAREVKDFDAIQILSQVDTGAHAVMNPETMEIELRGVAGFSLSDSIFARVIPTSGQVLVRQGRNLRFGGTVAVGRINLYSPDLNRPNFTFDYGSYKILCDSVESLRFNFLRNKPKDYQPSRMEKVLSNTVFNKITGAVHLDDPRNKSGRKNNDPSLSRSEEVYYAQFPVFDSYSQSFLYWDQDSIQSGVYHRDSLNFAIDPFVLDSLENFKESGLTFGGEFYSSQIFPRIRQKLAVMEDNTLGFQTVSPERGYYIYGRRGKFHDTLTMDGYGLHGNGTLEYLGTEAKSDTFTFFFDSVKARVSYFNLKGGYNVKAGVYFPEVNTENALYTWYIKDSTLKISAGYEELALFGGEGQFTGDLLITPGGMQGNGTISMGDVQVQGENIVFNEDDFSAAEADFTLINQDDPETPHFVARNAKIQYDVRRHRSTFESNNASEESSEFPLHQYATSLVRGTYQRSDSILRLETDSLSSPQYFVSTDPKQDSLRFNAKDAVYDLGDRAIRVAGVDSILVADAVVRPDSQKVTIRQDGLIQPLTNAVVEADKETKMHRMYEANIQIRSRHEYEGSGKYDYIEVNGNEQFITFENIRVNSSENTIASGEIRSRDAFYLTERIFFRGQAELDARNRFLSFEGEVRIESDNPVFKGIWFPFEKTVVNPDSVFIPISEETLQTEDGEKLTVGLVYQQERRYFYSRFLQTKEDPLDPTVISAEGGLTFDRNDKAFRIGSKNKLQGKVYKGSTVAFNDSANTIVSAGLLQFPVDFPDKTIAIKAAGQWQEDLDRNRISTNLLMGFDFQDVIPEDAFDEFEKKVMPALGVAAPDQEIEFQDTDFLNAAAELLDEGQKGEKRTQEFVANVEKMMTSRDITLNELLPFNLLLSGVDFKYNPDYKALYCDANVGLISLGGIALNRKVNSKIVYQYGTISASGEKQPDKLTILLELDRSGSNKFYLQFEEETLTVFFSSISFPEVFNEQVRSAIEKRKSDEGFRVELGDDGDIEDFTRNFVLRFIR